MTDPIVVVIPASPDGPAMRRRRGELPPPRQPRLNSYRLAKFANRLFNDKSEAEWRELLAGDWRQFMQRRFRLSDEQHAALSALDADTVASIADAARQLLESGGEVQATLPDGKRGGQLVLAEAGKERKRAATAAAAPGGGTTTGFTIPIIKCTFDANCRNWKCRRGGP